VADYIAAREQAEIASTPRQRDAWKAMKSFWENVDPERIDDAMCRKYAETGRSGQRHCAMSFRCSRLPCAMRTSRAGSGDRPLPSGRSGT
jgi:hypothetical protein